MGAADPTCPLVGRPLLRTLLPYDSSLSDKARQLHFSIDLSMHEKPTIPSKVRVETYKIHHVSNRLGGTEVNLKGG